jgi:anthranilate/para-aminobenzoate synthase component I
LSAVPERLLAIAEALEPPFLFLEDGRGGAILLWGATARLRLPWRAGSLGALERFHPGDGWCGALAYDLGLPPRARRLAPVLAQPVVDLFRPRNRIIIRSGDAICDGPDALRLWRAAGAAAGEGAAAGFGRGEHPGGAARPTAARASSRRPHRSFEQPDFERAVRQALGYIRAGDIYQVNLSVAELVVLRERPPAVYRRVRAINPSPWMGYADFGDWQLVSNSPELLVEVRDGVARARPIAGTRKKTGVAAHDAAMRAELAADEKERAEHVMLVDLARNDLGRVAAYGSVAVERFGTIEEYSHVMHLVSGVRARLAPGRTAWDAFTALFPGGTITGAPKIRSMEIIAALEPAARGMYTGALGWWAGGAGQWNILIRSAVMRGRRAVIQAGAGVVADSDPAREWKESLRKAAALRAACGAGDET